MKCCHLAFRLKYQYTNQLGCQNGMNLPQKILSFSIVNKIYCYTV